MRRLYRLLLKLYPPGFREEYEQPLEQMFMDEYRDRTTRPARLWFCLRALADLAVSIPVELLREILQDARHAVRVYRQRAFAASLACLAFALAAGVSTGVFSVVNALLLRSLPFRDAERLVIENRVLPRLDYDVPSFDAWLRQSAYLEDASAVRPLETNFGAGRDTIRGTVAETTTNFFNLLGAAPALGRGFAKGETGVAVIGYEAWQRFFGGDPRALGASVRVNGALFTVIGVAPPDFDYPPKAVAWTPTFFDQNRLPAAGSNPSYTLGRLKPGIGAALANDLYDAELRRARPAMKGEPKTQRWTRLRDDLAGPVRQASLVLMAFAAFVLSIACANVAQLLLSQATERRGELTIRAALGASRARLVRQLITESTLLTLVASAGGLIVAYWTARFAALAQPARLSTQDYAILDWRVLGFALGVAALTGVVFGVLPAFLTGHPQSGPARRMRMALIAAQAAIALTLVVGSLILGRAFLKLLGTDLGFQTRDVATLSVSLSGTRYEARHQEAHYYREALERLRAVPGVENAGGAEYLPLAVHSILIYHFRVDSGLATSGIPIAVTPGYFHSIGTSIPGGRDFNDADREGVGRVAIVDETFARAAGGAMVGRRLNTSEWDDRPGTRTIVGVVRTTRLSALKALGEGQVYVPVAQEPPEFLTFVARTNGNPERYLAACRDAVAQIDTGVPVFSLETFDRRLEESLARPRFYTASISFLAAFALLLAMVGAYGVAAHGVAQRTHEIGVRIAVGASPRRLRGMLLRENIVPVMVGIIIGEGCAAGLTRFLRHLVVSAEPVDGGAGILAAFVLASTAIAAIWAATARLTRLDPAAALRIE